MGKKVVEIEDVDSELEEQEEDEYQSNSDILEEEDNESDGSEMEKRAGAFGSKKENYYKDSDITDSDDSGEEHGADEIYHEQQQGLDSADFMDEDFAKRASDGEDIEEGDEKEVTDKGLQTEEEKERIQKIIKNLSPEILSLAKEMKVSMTEVCNKLLPLLEISEAKKIMVGKGQNYLEIRYEILLSYTLCILFYLMLKTKGRVTNNHPVLDRLTKYKTLIERMNISLSQFEELTGQVLQKYLHQKSKTSKKQLTFEQKMKMGKKESEQQLLAKKLQEEMKNMDGFSEDELSNDSSGEDMLSEDEEDIRIQKGAKAAKNANAVSHKQKNKGDKGEINMESIEPWMLGDEEDGDMILQEPKQVNLQAKSRKQKREDNAVPPEAFEDDFYKSVKEQQKQEVISKKAKRVQEKEKKKEEISKKYQIGEINDEQSRRITPQILKNRGNLVRKRDKMDGNARVKNRYKFERKEKIHNRNHGGKIYEQKQNYSGEMGAIKPSLVKSTKL